MKVEDILRKKGTRIGTVRINETVATALRLMKAENTGALVVKDVCRTEGNTVVGVISERHVVRALVDRGPGILDQPVSALMARDPCSCRPSDPVRHVLTLMDEHGVRHVPVLDGASLVGVVSVRDLIRRQLEDLPAAAEDDDSGDGDVVAKADGWDYPIAANQ
ncbi:CBS domain-containing protein [Azospirillum picis]|uniref:CBS domain-containing protein n=1 Tax=Azospirillum picis TaxID=488438 RepID=A0ABU0MHJ9_9PROT|nr:CBS domain-containing protein [Azospirillum picis]MBP2298846.1 CBS domain-containing protein [Azospirillum picis]MDQ0532912.1 CBS domain-containing protein [Azospirillum picis]